MALEANPEVATVEAKEQSAKKGRPRTRRSHPVPLAQAANGDGLVREDQVTRRCESVEAHSGAGPQRPTTRGPAWTTDAMADQRAPHHCRDEELMRWGRRSRALKSSRLPRTSERQI